MHVGLPDKLERQNMLLYFLTSTTQTNDTVTPPITTTITTMDEENKIPTATGAVTHSLSVLDWEELSVATYGWSGSDIETLCRHAG